MTRLVIAVLLTGVLATPPLALASGGSRTFHVTLTGRKAVPKGARHGHARARIAIRGSRVCWRFSHVRGLDHPRKARAFIDKAIPGEFGPVILQLGRRFRASGCATTTVGTTTSDFIDRTLHLGYVLSSTMLLAMVIAVLIVWRVTTGAMRAQLHKA